MNFSLTDRIRELAKKNGTSFFRMEKELHIGNGTIRAWDQNKPSYDKIVSVADYFGVSVDYLIGRDDEQRGLTREETRLLALFRSMNADGQAFLMQSAEMASARFFKTARDMGKNA